MKPLVNNWTTHCLHWIIRFQSRQRARLFQIPDYLWLGIYCPGKLVKIHLFRKFLQSFPCIAWILKISNSLKSMTKMKITSRKECSSRFHHSFTKTLMIATLLSIFPLWLYIILFSFLVQYRDRYPSLLKVIK